MLCRRCMAVMRTGTEYHSKRNNKDKGYRRFHECKKCHDKVYTNDPNFQEMLAKESERSRNR